jgi:hypothetical protein
MNSTLAGERYGSPCLCGDLPMGAIAAFAGAPRYLSFESIKPIQGSLGRKPF